MVITALRVPDVRSYRFVGPNTPDAPKLSRDHVGWLLRHARSPVAVDVAELLVQTASIRSQENRLVALLTGRPHRGTTVSPQQARRLATALRALFVGLSQGVLVGLAPEADEQYFADAARALTSTVLLGPE